MYTVCGQDIYLCHEPVSTQSTRGGFMHELHEHLQTVYAIEKLLAGYTVQPRLGMNQPLI